MLLFLARIGAGIASGIMVPAMLAYAYESNSEKKRVATVISFQALGWLVGIIAAGIANDMKLIFLVSGGFFLSGLLVTMRLPNITTEKELGRGIMKTIIAKNKYLFSSLLLRHIGATAVWTILPLVLMENLGASLYQVSIVYISNTLAAFVLMNLLAEKIKMSNITKFKIGIGLTAFVFIGMLVITEWWMAMPFMALVGITWAFLFIGGNIHLMENNPRSTATGIFSSTISIATVVGPIITGVLAFYYEYESVLYFAIAIIIVGFLISLKIRE
jgi:DHA1 family multidrug resistance protein-like MFS transporter